MTRKKVINFSKNKEDYQFQFACVLYLNLRQNKALKEKFDKFLSNQFDVTTSQYMKKILKQDNNHLVSFIMLYDENRSALVSGCRVLFSILALKIYVCVEYLSLQREP